MATRNTPRYARPVKNKYGAYQYATPTETVKALRYWTIWLEGSEDEAAKQYQADANEIEAAATAGY